MGIIRRNFRFIVGILFGAFIAQNYNVPNIKMLACAAFDTAKAAERKYRKRDLP